MKKIISLIVLVFVLSGCSSEGKSLSPSASETLNTLESDKDLISALFYDESQAYQSSFQSGIDFTLSHVYPNFIDTDVARECINQSVSEYGDWANNYVPDLSTVRLDPTWIPREPSENEIDLIWSGRAPAGTTYSVTTSADSELEVVHVTILNGQAYFYRYFCGI